MVSDRPTPQSPALPVLLAGFAVLSVALAASCSDPSSPNVGSNTNWLTACETDAQCSNALGCHCGACSLGCSVDSDCSKYPGTACMLKTDDAVDALCGGSATWSSQGICLPVCQPGSCNADQSCVLGACVPASLPDSAFCAAVSGATDEARIREEELIAAVQAVRQNGGIDCGSGTPTAALRFVRLDPRLTCAARVLAQDFVRSGSMSLTDSAGRTTRDRLTLAGYAARGWAEGYVASVSNADAALSAILRDAEFCAGFVNVAIVDIGVGYANGAYVLTLAGE